MSDPGQLDLGAVRVTKRTGTTYRPELALTRGPLVFGQAGQTWLSLLGSRWALGWLKGAALALYQLTGDDWASVPADLPALPDGARHVTVCFDQAAQVVTAWEDSGAVYVRQFDPFTHVYSVSGPFAGCDPVVVFDAVLTGVVPGSDVVLYYLSPDRLTLCHRLQRDHYGVEHVDVVLPSPALLDQAAGLPYQVQLVGENDGQPLTLRTELYAVAASDQATASTGGPSGGLLAGLVVLVAASDLAAASTGAPSGGLLAGLVVLVTAADQAAASTSGPTGGALAGSLVTVTVSNLAAASTGGPSSGALRTLVFTVTASNTSTASTTAPTGGTLA